MPNPVTYLQTLNLSGHGHEYPYALIKSTRTLGRLQLLLAPVCMVGSFALLILPSSTPHRGVLHLCQSVVLFGSSFIAWRINRKRKQYSDS